MGILDSLKSLFGLNNPELNTTQNVASNAVTGANPVTANVAPEQTGMFGGGQSGAGSMAQSELGGLSGGTAMPATEGQPTDVAGAEANTGTIPAGVVKPVTTTPVTYPGTQTAVTPQSQASGNLPINFSFEEDLTAKGKQAGGDVQSQALMDMAQQAIQRGGYRGAEAMLRRPLTNQDFFAGPGMRESRTAWGDPIFTGEGQLFPMAVLDARQKAQAQVRNMAIEDDVLNMTIPTVNVAGLRENYSRDFVADSEAFMRDGIKRYGSAGNAIKAMKKSGEWAKHMSKWKATAEAINTTGKMATDFLTKAKEGMQKGDTFASPEALASATMFLNGLEEFSQGNIGPERLAQLQNMFYTTESWSKYLNENKDKVKPIEFTPDFKALDTAENRAAYEAVVQEIPVDRRPGYSDWLVTTKIAEVAKPQAISTLIEPFLRSNPTAFEQFRLMYPGKKDEEIIDALGNSVAQMYGRQLTTSMVGESPQSNTNINVNTGVNTPGADKGIYTNTALSVDKVLDYLKSNLRSSANINDVIKNASVFGDASKSFTPDKTYVGFGLPGKWGVVNENVAVKPFNEYVFDSNSDGVFESFSAEGMTGLKGIPMNTSPTSAKIKDVIVAFGVPDPKSSSGYRIITQDAIKRGDELPDNAIPVAIQHTALTYNIDSEIKSLQSNTNKTTEQAQMLMELMNARKADKIKSSVTKTAYEVFPFNAEVATAYDNLGSKSVKQRGFGTGTPEGGSKAVDNSSSSNDLVE